jgi:hypothetical protein
VTLTPETIPQLQSNMQVWIRSYSDGKVDVQVMGHPPLFAHGESQNEAIDALMALMSSFCDDESDMTESLARARDFAKSVF